MDDIIIRSALDVAILSLFYFAFKVWRKVWALRNKPVEKVEPPKKVEAPPPSNLRVIRLKMDYDQTMKLARIHDAASALALTAAYLEEYQYIDKFIRAELGDKIPAEYKFDCDFLRKPVAIVTVKEIACP